MHIDETGGDRKTASIDLDRGGDPPDGADRGYPIVDHRDIAGPRLAAAAVDKSRVANDDIGATIAHDAYPARMNFWKAWQVSGAKWSIAPDALTTSPT